VFLIATKKIDPGEEIYTSYGFDYWDFFLKREFSKLNQTKLP
jgi:hypothetical protein